MKTHLAAAGVFIAAFFGACRSANAGSIIQSFTVPGNNQSTATQWTYTDSSTTLFNPTLGTLDDIIFTINASATASSQLTDNNPGDRCPGAGCSADSYLFSTVTDFHLKDGTNPDPATLPLVGLADAVSSEPFTGVAYGQVMDGSTTATVTGNAIYDVLGTSGLCSNPGAGCLETGATVGTNPPATDVDPLNISDFEGVGNKTYTVRALTVGGWFGPPSLAGAVSGTAEATVTIEYDFTPTTTQDTAPEPASFVLFASVLACLGIGRRFKNRLRAQ